MLGRCQWVELHQSGRCRCNSDLTAVCFTKATETNINHHTITVAHLCGDNSWRSSGGTSSFLRKKSCTARLSGGLKVSTAHRPPIFRSFRAATKPARERTREEKKHEQRVPECTAYKLDLTLDLNKISSRVSRWTVTTRDHC